MSPSNKPESTPNSIPEVDENRRGFLKMFSGKREDAIESTDEKAITRPEKLTSRMGRRAMIITTAGAALAGVLGLANPAKAQDGRQYTTIPDSFLGKEGYTDEEEEILATKMQLMCDAEVVRMQKTQEAIYRCYFDPNTVMSMLGNKNDAKKVDDALLNAMRYLHDLEYSPANSSGYITITRRTKSDESSLDDIEIIIDQNGRVVTVQDEKMPYYKKGEYEELYINLNYSRWEKSLIDSLQKMVKRVLKMNTTAEEKRAEIGKQMGEILKKEPNQMLKLLFELNNVTMPQRLANMIEARNTNMNFDKDRRGQAYQNFQLGLSHNGTSYDDMAENFWTKFQQVKTVIKPIINADGEKDYVWMFESKADPGSPDRGVLAVSHEGYILKTDVEIKRSGGKTKRVHTPVMHNPHYDNRVKSEYDRQNPPNSRPQLCTP